MFLTSEQKRVLDSALRSSGLFVSCGKAKPNLMSTHWGALGSFWGKQVFVLPVRPGKLSYETIESEKSFAISVPTVDMRREIMLCDHMSGYTVNKFEELHLHPKRAHKIPAYVLGECGLILECKVIFTASAGKNYIASDLQTDFYNGKECHKMFFGEVIDCYER